MKMTAQDREALEIGIQDVSEHERAVVRIMVARAFYLGAVSAMAQRLHALGTAARSAEKAAGIETLALVPEAPRGA